MIIWIVSDRKLPEKDEFYSLLTDENISDEQYKHAQKFGIILI